jgi:hypothetical protein
MPTRDEFATCPRCACGLDVEGTRFVCGQCHGQLIVDRELFDLISSAQIKEVLEGERKNPWAREPLARKLELVEPPVPEALLRCPRCTVMMTKHGLYDVVVDRCEGHGVWLDGDAELTRIVANAVERI